MSSLSDTLTTLLRRSERYTRTDMVYLAGGGFWLGLGYAAQMASGILLTLALANLIPKESYGTYQFILSMAAILGGFALTGLGTALMRAVAKGATGALPYAFRTQLLWGLGTVVTSGAVALYYFINGNTELAIAFLIVGACSPLLAAFSLYRPYLEGRKLFRESAVEGAWRRPIPLLAILIALLVTDDPIILVLVYFVSHTLSMGLLYLRTIQAHPETPVKNPEMVGYGKHLSVIAFVGLVANNIDNVIVFHYLGAAPLAAYALAQLPLTHTLKFFGLGSSLIFPKYAARSYASIRAGVLPKLAVYILAAILALLAYFFAAPYIFGIMFPDYPEAVLLSQFLMLSVLAKPFTLYAQTFAAHGKKGVQHFLQISVSALKIILLIALLPAYGLWGAAAATVIGAAYWAVASLVLFYRRSLFATAS